MRFGSLIPFLLLALAVRAAADTPQCGKQANNSLCHDQLCCSYQGYCGSTPPYCGEGCQSQCHGNFSDMISWEEFNEMLPHRNDAGCPASGFYTYDSLMIAAESFQAFGMKGDLDTRKREIAAFLAQTSHETAGEEGPDAPEGPFTWGYCLVEEPKPHGNYCVDSQQWPCASGKEYYGRGPIQISYNYNYGPAGKAIDYDLLNNPDVVATDAVVSFKTALWFWMTPQGSKPSCHDVINGEWQPTAEDEAAGRVPGYGLITNIINGEVECGNGTNPQMEYRIGFYKRYCDVLNVAYGDNLDCSDQKPFP